MQTVNQSKYRDDYFVFTSTGYLKPVNGWWMLLSVDPEIVKYYCWLAKTWGIQIDPGSRHGPHISVIKGEKPKSTKRWFDMAHTPIIFKYTNQIRHNDYHVWLDVRCPELSKVRQSLGLKPKPYHSFHLTIGRFRHNIGHEAHEPRPRKRNAR